MEYNRIKEKYQKSLNLNKIEVSDNVGQMITKINNNFLEIQNNNGGPMGPVGPIGPPGQPGLPGPPGVRGENALEEWNSGIGISCSGANVSSIDGEIYNKYVGKNLLLSNIYKQGDLRIISNEIGLDEITEPLINENYKDTKLKIYNSDSDGKGKHIQLVNSKAAVNNYNYMCKSGFSISLDWGSINNDEILKISGNKNIHINGHNHSVNIESNYLDLNRKENSQKIRIDAGIGNSNFKSNFILETLTNDRLVTIPEKTGYMGIWQDTNEHSQIWETVSYNDILIRYGRYYNGSSDETLEENHKIYIDDQSEIRFKRLNNFILIDFHIGVRRLVDYDNFYIKNLQFKVNKETLGARTIGWDIFSILESEAFEDDNGYQSNAYYTITPTDTSASNVNDTFLISMKFKNNDILEFNSVGKELYWFKGQVWATLIDEDTSCLQLDIEQENVCPYIEVY